MVVAEQIGPYVNRLFDDDSVRDQLGDALAAGAGAPWYGGRDRASSAA